MLRAGEIRVEEIGGRRYGLRAPDLHDPARARRILTRQGVRRPSLTEFKVASLQGIEKIAEQAGEVAEGARQRETLERWYELLVPVDEDALEEPNPIERAKAAMHMEAERQRSIVAIYPDVQAIEATLERHWPPYAELLADRTFWDDVSRIEIVRLLLVEADGAKLPRDDEGMLTEDAYRAIPRAHIMPLATAAFRLLSPDEAQRKN